MPIIASAKKQLRQSLKRKKRNDNFRALYRESRIAFEKAIKTKNLETAKTLYVNAKDKD
jgi:ribosomal protein S20